MLNNEKYVRIETCDRIRAAISELNYTPSLAARQLAANRSFLFIIIIDAPSVASCERLFLAAASECRRFGYHLIVETYEVASDRIGIISSLIERLKPDGIMLTAAHWHDDQVGDYIRRNGVPLICIADVSDSYGVSIQESERRASEALVGHLIALGHRRIAMIAPPERYPSAEKRLQGYLDAISKSGIAVDKDLVKRGDFSFASGARIASRFLRMDIRPTAIFAANDRMALGAMAAARQTGIRIPEDLAVAGFEDSREAAISLPRLSTVRPPHAAIARAAVAALLGSGIDVTDMRHRLILRRSTAYQAGVQ